jgi:hypothetical protein
VAVKVCKYDMDGQDANKFLMEEACKLVLLLINNILSV